MKTRLQSLWDEISPESGPCPQPDRKAVRHWVDAALDQKARALHPWRAVRLAAICAAALVLLTGTALAAGALLPEYNVLSVFFNRGENAPGSEGLVNPQPVSVSDDNYTLTVTTSIADGSSIYLTVLIQGKTPQAAAQLSDEAFPPDDGPIPLTVEMLQPSGAPVLSGHRYEYGAYDAASRTRQMNVVATVNKGAAARVSVRLNLMEEGLWLTLPVEPIHTVTLEINAEGQSAAWPYSGASGPVTVEQIKLSPLSYQVRYTSEEHECYPMVFFLWKDGGVTTLRQMAGVEGPGSGSSVNGGPYTLTFTHNFRSVQDLSQMEAVVFGGLAYPLDGGAPYAVDVDALPQHELAP